MTNPNYMKTVAPRTAAAVRKLVNTHPELSKIVQFNSAIGVPAISGLAGESEQGAPGL